MTQATIRAACAIPEREKARELALPGPSNFSTPNSGHSAAALNQQAANFNRDGYGRDGSRLIRNPGHLKQSITKVHDLMWLRRKRQGICAADEANIYFVIGVIEETIAAIDPNFVRDLANWSERNQRRLNRAARAEIDAEVRQYGASIEVTQRWLGEQLVLLDEERDQISFRYALPFDLDEQGREAKRKAKDAERQRNNSKTPRDSCLARQRPPGMAATTFYRHVKKAAARCPKEGTGGGKTPPNRGAKKAPKSGNFPPNCSVAPTLATVLTSST